MERPEGEGQGTVTSVEGERAESPSEKLSGNPPPGEHVPGAENPESREVKKEVNPNTE